MTDLEITKLCAEAMGLILGPDWDQGYVMLGGHSGITPSKYDPLHDDAQAMALVKRFRITCSGTSRSGLQYWQAWTGGDLEEHFVVRPDLNRAICECVAKMQSAK